MKKMFIVKIYLLTAILFLSISVSSQSLTLVQDSKSDYFIIIPKKASINERIAAKILGDYIEKISGCRLPVFEDSKKKAKNEILIGLTNRIKGKSLKNKKAELKKDGYFINTIDDRLMIIGGSGKGVIYGVTGFLEDHLKCRKYSPSAEYIPKSASIEIPAINETQVPPADIRIVHCEFTDDSLYSYFRKISSIADIWNDGDYHGYYVHTLPRIIPSEKYFSGHPEYFALINGERVPYGQYCLSNPDVLKIVIEDLTEQIRQYPSLNYWSVSQSDNYYQCECDKCKAIDEEERSASGLMIRFVNEVAKAFPDKIITTLAYQYTRKPPLLTKPLSNVMVTLCTIELNRSKAIESDPGSSDFVEEIADWAKITDNIMLWDYETQFSNSFGPFPIYNTLKPNVQFFTKNNVTAHFQQCNGKHSENFGELKCYLLSKLLWNPDANDNHIINDFLSGYYGDAGIYIRYYFDLLHSECKKSGTKLDIYGSPVWLSENILSESNIKKYNDIFDKAESAVADNAQVLNRVKVARMPVMFSAIEIAKTDLFGQRGWYKEENGKYVKKEEMNKLLDDFYYLCRHDSILSLNEKGLSPEFYYNTTLRNIDVQVDGNKAFKKKVSCSPAPDPRYTGMGNQMLTNGVRGSEDFKINWLGWEGMDCEIEIDLDSIQNLNEISISALHMPDVWILYPESIKCLTSEDGKIYSELGAIKSDPELKYKTDIRNFTFKAENIRTRYIKFQVKSMMVLPQWHTYKGNKAWVFIDEIVVK